jgi:hypothetical protein
MPAPLANDGMEVAAMIQFASTKLTPCFDPWLEIVIFIAGLTLLRPNKPIGRFPPSVSVALACHVAYFVIHFHIPERQAMQVSTQGQNNENGTNVKISASLKRAVGIPR